MSQRRLRNLHCAEPRRVDRVFFRSSATLALNPTSWKTDARFVEAQGNALSDHLAVAVEFARQVLPAVTPKLGPTQGS